MKLLLDCECYLNYFSVGIENVDTYKKLYFEIHNDDFTNFNMAKVKNLVLNHTIIGFNLEGYDNPMLKACFAGYSNAQLKQLSDDIVSSNNLKGWQVDKKFGLPRINIDYIDLMCISPGFGSLKLRGGRLHSKKLQDLPIEPDAIITVDRAEKLKDYCINGDLELTRDLYEKLIPEIELREVMSKQYKTNLKTKSDAQIAEAVFKLALTKAGVDVHRTAIEAGAKFTYKVPSFVTFKSDEFKDALEKVKRAVFVVNEKGSVLLPKEIASPIPFDGAKYKMGMGGLHSCEKKQSIVAGPNQTLVDKDVVSYYPSIILNQGLYPQHLTPEFNNVYRAIVEKRIAAKTAGDMVTSNSLKVVINSSFGKFGNQYSALYSPELLIQTTISGQLSLLMLIESLVAIGVKVYSANTDGIVLLFDNDKTDEVNWVCQEWENTTGFVLEDTFYKALYSRDVNNYFAVKPNDACKGKGMFTLNSLSKNTANTICYIAVMDYLIHGKTIEDTILNCTDMTKFVSIRTVNGGAVCQGVMIGKAIRWYYSTTTTECIRYARNDNKVPKTEGALPMMNLGPIPVNLDYQYYITEAVTILESLGLTYE
tara:strand:+ start:164 stop:1942 length:1779 start_codon:yes stop_codon:yes gene_type:complete